MSPVGVMHMLDALKIGGAERVAVDLVNLLPRDRFSMYLCTTRTDGPFSDLVSGDVTRLSLGRQGRFDAGALRRLLEFIRANGIRILHAHGSSLFFARLASLFRPYPMVVWHDHYGRHIYNDRPAWLYRAATRRVAGVIAVNRPLADWSRQVLGVPSNRIWYIPNLIQSPQTGGIVPDLPGKPGSRIVCLANIRPQKDHSNLLRAMALLKAKIPDAYLMLVGDTADPAYRDSILSEIPALGLEQHVSHLGPRHDVAEILSASDVGVLSSRSEGLPLALLEYGISGLPAISTNVGQCAEVLDDGAAGLLVPPSDPQALADALFTLLTSPTDRALYAGRLRERVESLHSPARVIGHVCDVYQALLDAPSPAGIETKRA